MYKWQSLVRYVNVLFTAKWIISRIIFIFIIIFYLYIHITHAIFYDISQNYKINMILFLTEHYLFIKINVLFISNNQYPGKNYTYMDIFYI